MCSILRFREENELCRFRRALSNEYRIDATTCAPAAPYENTKKRGPVNIRENEHREKMTERKMKMQHQTMAQIRMSYGSSVQETHEERRSFTQLRVVV